MESQDDDHPLFHYEEDSRDINLELTVQYIRISPEFEQVVYGYKKNDRRTVLLYISSVLTFGIPFLLFHWCPAWFIYTTHVKCCFLEADQVIVLEMYQKKCKNISIHSIVDTSRSSKKDFLDEFSGEQDLLDSLDAFQIPIHLEDGSTLNTQNFRFFRHKKQTMIWDTSCAMWLRLVGIECGATCAQLHAMGARPPSRKERTRLLSIYGLNEIKVPVQSIITLILLEVCNPCYAIQLFTIAVWLADAYYYYCVAVVVMTTFGVATSVVQTRMNQQNLRATVEAHDWVEVWGGRQAGSVDSRHMCPGDVVVLPARGCTLHADLVLLTGAAVLNESMLTGESVPVTKTALPRVDKPFNIKEHASNILFCGTKVIQTRYYNNEPVKALVLRTGYNTSKGQLVRRILYPVPADLKLDWDSYKFIMILASCAIIGLIFTMALKAYRESSPGNVALNALDIITIAIPPALPTAMTVARLYAVSRLKQAHIACLNNRAVNVSGSLDCICFDKTGTLTEDGLDMWGVVSVSAATSPPRLGRAQREPRLLNDLHDLKIGMAACHSLTLLDTELAGDPLDLKIFESTGWTLQEPDIPGTSNHEILRVVKPSITNINEGDDHMPLEVGIVQQHQFVSSLQRSSVVARVLGEDVLRVYCKGAPEMLSTLCKPETVPANLNEVLNSYAAKGYRVIALTTRVIEATIAQLQWMTRSEVECDLQFLGLIIMENRLNGVTTGVIKELKDANIHVAMITGDNIHTAVSVAKECGILCSGERVVQLHVDAEGKTPIVYCESTLHGAPVGRRTPLQRSWRSMDSGRGSLRDSGSGSGSDSYFGSGSGFGSGFGSDSGPDSPPGSGLLDVEGSAEKPRYKIIMTGNAWQVLREHYPQMVGAVVERGAVFARMTSDQKEQIIMEYQALGYYVGMCGDGANDCGALRAAHTGISLSELESSVAAPFTSQNPDIVCVSRVLHEGRAALATSFGVFKFMFAYSLTKFFSVTFLYYFDSNLTDIQFLYIDVGLIINFAFFFGNTKPYTGQLCKIPPLTSLLSLVPLFALVGQLVLIGVTQYLCYYILTLFPWYVRNSERSYECWENYAIYAVSMFQYIILALVFNHGSPYRRSVVTNKPFMIIVFIMTGMCVHIAVWPEDYLAKFLNLRLPNDSLLSYLILVLAFLNFVVALLFERVVIEHLMVGKQMIPKFLKEKRISKTPHLIIKRQLSEMDYLDCVSDIKYDKENGLADSKSVR